MSDLFDRSNLLEWRCRPLLDGLRKAADLLGDFRPDEFASLLRAEADKFAPSSQIAACDCQAKKGDWKRVAEACEFYGVTPKNLRKRIAALELPSYLEGEEPAIRRWVWCSGGTTNGKWATGIGEASEYYGVSEWTIKKRVSSNEIPSYLKGQPPAHRRMVWCFTGGDPWDFKEKRPTQLYLMQSICGSILKVGYSANVAKRKEDHGREGYGEIVLVDTCEGGPSEETALLRHVADAGFLPLSGRREWFEFDQRIVDIWQEFKNGILA